MGGGKSRSNTGIDVFDDVVNTAVNNVTNPILQGAADTASDVLYGIGTGNFNSIGGNLVGGEGSRERAAREAEAKTNEQVIADQAAATSARQREFEGTIAGIVDQRRRAPGRAPTLLSSLPGQGTLLTMRGA